jgi:hypothetical protein
MTAGEFHARRVGAAGGELEPASSFRVKTAEGEETPVLEAVKAGNYHRDFVDDLERCEYFVPVQWLQTVPIEKPINEAGLFGNQNTVCKPITPKWRSTVARLKEHFPHFETGGLPVDQRLDVAPTTHSTAPVPA